MIKIIYYIIITVFLLTVSIGVISPFISYMFLESIFNYGLYSSGPSHDFLAETFLDKFSLVNKALGWLYLISIITPLALLLTKIQKQTKHAVAMACFAIVVIILTLPRLLVLVG